MKSLFDLLRPEFEAVNKAVEKIGGLQMGYECSGWLEKYFQRKEDAAEGVLFDPWFAVIEFFEPKKDDDGNYKGRSLYMKVFNPENYSDFFIMGLGTESKKGGLNRFGQYIFDGGYKNGDKTTYRAPAFGEKCFLFYKGQNRNSDGDFYHDWAFRFSKEAAPAFPESDDKKKNATKKKAASKPNDVDDMPF